MTSLDKDLNAIKVAMKVSPETALDVANGILKHRKKLEDAAIRKLSQHYQIRTTIEKAIKIIEAEKDKQVQQ